MRLALGVSYGGSAYQGWQRQLAGPTVQGCLEQALSAFAAGPIGTVCAGRTDAGVHGLNQVIHLDTDLVRPPMSWVRGTNRYLPSDIAVQWCHPVSDEFHARFSAQGRRYVYLLLQSPVRPALESGRAGWVFRPLDLAAMQAGAVHLIGEHDFSAFRSAQCQARSPIKQLHRIEIRRHAAYWRFDFEGSAFLHHMVRNIMGCLMAVGQGARPSDWVAQVLRSADRRQAAPTFSPAGLYFAGPYYDPAWGLPEQSAAADWLPLSRA
ncbi:MAG: tRNA pseudouridine(38-40) synthase TruA [Pseudomonadota bacterium]